MSIEKENVPVTRETQGRKQGRWSLRNLKELLVGSNDRFFGVDVRGLWLGARDYADAPFRVNQDGEIEASSFSGSEVTAKRVQTSASGQRVVIDDTSNTIKFYNSANELVLELQGLTSFTLDSQIKMAGGITGTSKDNANYDAGFRIWNAGFGATGVACIIDAFNNETASVTGRMAVRTDGEVWFYGTGSSPVARITATGGIIATLPTSDPGTSGALWNDSGTVKVS